jgi:hypothetical protein
MRAEFYEPESQDEGERYEQEPGSLPEHVQILAAASRRSFEAS